MKKAHQQDQMAAPGGKILPPGKGPQPVQTTGAPIAGYKPIHYLPCVTTDYQPAASQMLAGGNKLRLAFTMKDLGGCFLHN